MDKKRKNRIKEDIKNNAIAGSVGGLGGYTAGVAYGVGRTKAEYIKNKKKYIKMKMEQNKNLDKKQLARHFDEMELPVKRIIPYVNSTKIKPQKYLYDTKMQMEGAKRGVRGLLVGIPAAVTVYSAYDSIKDDIKDLRKGDKKEWK